MPTEIPPEFEDMVPGMLEDHVAILDALRRSGYTLPEATNVPIHGSQAGSAAAKAYPIQGILKYHGMADWRWRTAYLPSVSVNSDAAYTVTLVSFEPALRTDRVAINGVPADGREADRVIRVLDEVRSLAGIASRASVVSRNVVRAARVGKGLGTSASASAALAAAAMAAARGEEVLEDWRAVSCMARLLAGSGCRSAVGGISVWLSYPGIPHEESYAVRLDDASQLDDVRLLTVPIDSRIGLKTEMAHRDAPASPLFRPWLQSRRAEIIECIKAVRAGDWDTVGQLAELDSIRLHAVTMTGSREDKLFAWEPENMVLFRLCNDLRSSGVPVYFSTDTGPTTVFITHRDHEDAVVAAIRGLDQGLEVVRGRIAGPAALVDLADAQGELGL